MRLARGNRRNQSMLELNYGIISTVAAIAAGRCYMKFVRGPEPKNVDMSGKVSVESACGVILLQRLLCRLELFSVGTSFYRGDI